ncbi:MAG: glutamyl-tRNA amidotransferase [Novosphingobium sp. SCN 66-18]|nr:MAG: glutamyl-tRNA amidotransferase [Novosphingobium sp. SCN 66-18]
MADAIIIQAMSLGGDGLRVAVKDSLDIAGYPTRGGSAALADAPPAARHADVVQAVLDAGCRIIGKANMHELAYGVTGVNGWTGTPANPLYPGHVPGGSSSGSAAAVAAGLCDFALGTDTGGSIRTPAACCGVFGLKPTFGRVSRRGAHPAVSSLDCVGPFALSMAMLEQAMAIIDPTFQAVETPSAIRLGRVACTADPAVAHAFDAALAGSAAHLKERTLPGMDDAFAANIAIIGAETWAAFGSLVASPDMGDDVRQRLLNASKVNADDLARAEQVRARFRGEVDAALEGVDALVLPTMPVFVPTLEEAADAAAMLKLTALVRQFNLSGHPALSIPVATPTGLPIGIQLVGRIGGDAALCAAARALAPSLDIPTYLQREEQA